MNADALFIIFSIGLSWTCIAAVGARTLREFSRHELEDLCERNSHPERFSDIIRHDDDVTLGLETAVVIGISVATVSGVSWSCLRYGTPLGPGLTPGEGWGFFLITLALVVLSLLTSVVWLPWSVSRLGAASLVYHGWPAWRSLNASLAPMNWARKILDTVLHRLAGQSPNASEEDAFEEEIRTIVTEGHREGLLDEEAREMIEGVIDLSDRQVSEIMTPRTDVHMVQVNLPWDQLIEEVISCAHTRIPVYDKNRDDVLGMLYSKDLLPELAKGSDQPRRPVTELLRKPLFVPEAKAVHNVLQMFQHTRTHIAVVLDEYGGVSGLVTIEDVLEEIVGEIVDEYDADVEDELSVIDPDTMEALGKAHVEEINEKMGLDLPEDDDFDTIGGFVFTELGRIPLPGEEFVWQEQVQVTVLEVTHRRVDRVRIKRLTPQPREIA